MPHLMTAYRLAYFRNFNDSRPPGNVDNKNVTTILNDNETRFGIINDSDRRDRRDAWHTDFAERGRGR